MKLSEMKEEYEKAKADYQLVTTRTARMGINEELSKLSKKIRDEERRTASNLKSINVNGIEYELPTSFAYYEDEDKYTYEIKDGCLYRFQRMKLDKDGSFHLLHHVWIPQATNKFVNLCVRTLGGDRFGERYYLSASYYKHPSDDHSYMHKDVRTDNYNYKPYYTYIIDKMGFKQKKDRRETNLLERKEKQMEVELRK